jgi:hypothetical protein
LFFCPDEPKKHLVLAPIPKKIAFAMAAPTKFQAFINFPFAVATATRFWFCLLGPLPWGSWGSLALPGFFYSWPFMTINDFFVLLVTMVVLIVVFCQVNAFSYVYLSQS